MKNLIKSFKSLEIVNYQVYTPNYLIKKFSSHIVKINQKGYSFNSYTFWFPYCKYFLTFNIYK